MEVVGVRRRGEKRVAIDGVRVPRGRRPRPEPQVAKVSRRVRVARSRRARRGHIGKAHGLLVDQIGEDVGDANGLIEGEHPNASVGASGASPAVEHRDGGDAGHRRIVRDGHTGRVGHLEIHARLTRIGRGVDVVEPRIDDEIVPGGILPDHSAAEEDAVSFLVQDHIVVHVVVRDRIVRAVLTVIDVDGAEGRIVVNVVPSYLSTRLEEGARAAPSTAVDVDGVIEVVEERGVRGSGVRHLVAEHLHVAAEDPYAPRRPATVGALEAVADERGAVPYRHRLDEPLHVDLREGYAAAITRRPILDAIDRRAAQREGGTRIGDEHDDDGGRYREWRLCDGGGETIHDVADVAASERIQQGLHTAVGRRIRAEAAAAGLGEENSARRVDGEGQRIRGEATDGDLNVLTAGRRAAADLEDDALELLELIVERGRAAIRCGGVPPVVDRGGRHAAQGDGGRALRGAQVLTPDGHDRPVLIRYLPL